MSVAIIPARGGSSRVPRKNIRLFFGKPILYYSIETARMSGLFDQVVVSTDDREIADIALQYGAAVHARPAELARDEVGTQDVIARACMDLRLRSGDLVGCFYATAPLMRVADILRAQAALQEKPTAPYAYSCALKPLRNYDLIHDAGQFYLGQAGAFVSGIPLTAEDVLKIIVPNEFVCDINTIEDWATAEAMYRALHPGVGA